MEEMIKTPYITVAVTLPVMKSYTYKIPEYMQNCCRPGMRVLVPFGRRRVTGYILSDQKECKGFKAKKIIDILDDHPLFPESEISFFKWISDYYIHPLGDVIKTALPSGFDRSDISHVSVTENGKKCLNNGSLTPGQEAVIESVLKCRSCTLQRLKQNSPNKVTNSLVRSMEKKDLITVSAVLKKDGAKIKTEKFILNQDVPETHIRMSKKRKQLLDIVKKHKDISLTGLKKYIPTAPALIKPLAGAGYVKIIERQVFRDPLGDPVEPDIPPELTMEQQRAVKQVQDHTDDGFRSYLLSGVTGSGKTEVYMRLVQDVVEKGKTAIVLVPEISLISQTERRFRARFGENIAVIHSSLTRGERIDQWRKISLQKVNIVIGARSALFSPLDDIGSIIVDEEHDNSYKQDTGLRYNARDLAVVRAKLSDCPVILGSATPSVQSYQNVVTGRFEEIKLQNRINRQLLPEIDLIDLKKYQDVRGYERIITPELAREIRSCLNQGNQTLIFLNRRGFSTFPVCMDCGKSLSCKYCDITMTLHKRRSEYKCHICGYGHPVKIKCPECSSSKIKPLGFGTEKIESMLKAMFPDARVTRMDHDSTSRKGSAIKILKNIRNRNVDIIVGTQMLAKGHDFPFITLVGVICADLSLSLPDFRAGERTFQLLAQVAGRAGRGTTAGKVVMQTFNPDHFIIKAAKQQDFFNFFQKEVPFRKALMYPPFSRMVQIKLSGRNALNVKKFSENVVKNLGTIIKDKKKTAEKVQILGPIEAPIQKIASRFRWQILVKSPSSKLLNSVITSMMDHPETKAKAGVRMIIDVDPYSLM